MKPVKPALRQRATKNQCAEANVTKFKKLLPDSVALFFGQRKEFHNSSCDANSPSLLSALLALLMKNAICYK